MWDYTDKVMDFFYNPRNQGTIAEKEESEKVVTGEVGSIACGDAMRLHLKVDEPTQKIVDARFQTFGCASAIASSSALTEMLKGKTIEEAEKISNREIAEYLGGLPEEKMHCSVMGEEALEAAIKTYKGIPLESHEDDEGALICRCFGVSDTKIRRVIVENGLTTAEQVTNYVKAGGGCSTCLPEIDDILADVQQQRDLGLEVATGLHAAKAEPETPKPLTNLQKIALIQKVLTEDIKPFLAQDGGDVELFDVEGDRVKVILKGACGSCESSLITLKVAIEARLKEAVSPELVVEAV